MNRQPTFPPNFDFGSRMTTAQLQESAIRIKRMSLGSDDSQLVDASNKLNAKAKERLFNESKRAGIDMGDPARVISVQDLYLVWLAALATFNSSNQDNELPDPLNHPTMMSTGGQDRRPAWARKPQRLSLDAQSQAAQSAVDSFWSRHKGALAKSG